MKPLSISHTCILDNGIRYFNHQVNPVTEKELHDKIKLLKRGKHDGDLLHQIEIKRAPLRLTEPMKLKN